MCRAFHDLRSNNVVTGSSLILYLVFAFSDVQGPVKELRLSFMPGSCASYYLLLTKRNNNNNFISMSKMLS